MEILFYPYRQGTKSLRPTPSILTVVKHPGDGAQREAAPLVTIFPLPLSANHGPDRMTSLPHDADTTRRLLECDT